MTTPSSVIVTTPVSSVMLSPSKYLDEFMNTKRSVGDTLKAWSSKTNSGIFVPYESRSAMLGIAALLGTKTACVDTNSTKEFSDVIACSDGGMG
jgi:hypothetical protein